MASILTPGYLKWDGLKYVLDAGQAGNFIQSAQSQITVDTATASTSFSNLLTLSMTFGSSGTSIAIVRFTGAGSTSSGTNTQFQLMIDGYAVSAANALSVSTSLAPVAIQYRTALAFGVHTFTVRWKLSGAGAAAINPVSAPNNEHATIIVEEVLA